LIQDCAFGCRGGEPSSPNQRCGEATLELQITNYK
jgi:hypothetical protein